MLFLIHPGVRRVSAREDQRNQLMCFCQQRNDEHLILNTDNVKITLLFNSIIHLLIITVFVYHVSSPVHVYT